MSDLLKNIANYSSDRISLKNISLENYISTENLLQNKKGKNNATNLPPKGEFVTKYEIGDILVSNIRPYLKKIWYANNIGGSSSDVLTIKVNKENNSKFVYYALFRDEFFDYVMAGSKGTKMPRGDKNQVMNFSVPKFDYFSQTQISKVLSDLDTKIELNNKINAELEAMAKLIYDYWFVQFDFPNEEGKPYKSSGGKMVWDEELKREIPEGWEVKNLSQWIDKDKSGDWGKELREGNYSERVFCIRGADLNGLNGKGEVKAPERYILEKNSHKILEPHDLIVEISGGSPIQSTGRMAYITNESLERFDAPIICSNFCKAVTLKDEKSLYNFAFEWIQAYNNGVLFGYEGKTSGIKNLLFESFVSAYYVSVPTKQLIEKFYDFMTPLEQKKQKNLLENQKLSELRDWLLPMLMNGQVKVS